MGKKRKIYVRPMVDPALEERLRNWGRWARVRIRREHCASIEWKFSIPKFRALDAMENGTRPFDLVEILRKPETEPVDEGEAWRTEIAVVSARLNDKDRAVLKAHYVLLAFPRDTCRALHIRLVEYDRRLAEAAQRAHNVMKIMEAMEGHN